MKTSGPNKAELLEGNGGLCNHNEPLNNYYQYITDSIPVFMSDHYKIVSGDRSRIQFLLLGHCAYRPVPYGTVFVNKTGLALK